MPERNGGQFLASRSARGTKATKNHLQHVGGVPPVTPETMHEAVEARQFSEAATIRRKLTKKRAIRNDLRCKTFDDKGASEYLNRHLRGLRVDMKSQSLDNPRLLQMINDLENELQGPPTQLVSLQQKLKVAHV